MRFVRLRDDQDIVWLNRDQIMLIRNVENVSSSFKTQVKMSNGYDWLTQLDCKTVLALLESK